MLFQLLTHVEVRPIFRSGNFIVECVNANFIIIRRVKNSRQAADILKSPFAQVLLRKKSMHSLRISQQTALAEPFVTLKFPVFNVLFVKQMAKRKGNNLKRNVK